ncbi:MAG: aminoglycoside phosphotransferase family protein [Mariprofundaceae bacterium]|nr:aminoglycoside phosphotransferase family protein [Mariprofundaceae bacterium]
MTDTLKNNVRFLMIEVETQLSLLQTYTQDPEPIHLQRMSERSAYIYNLNLRIQNSILLNTSEPTPLIWMQHRTLNAIASDLVHITRLCHECMQQWVQTEHFNILDLSPYRLVARQLNKSLQHLEQAFWQRDTRLALHMGLGEHKISRQCQKMLKTYTTKLKQRQHTEVWIAGLFTQRCCQQTGESLLRISEAIISNNLGQPMDMPRFHALQDTVSAWNGEQNMIDMDIQSVAETRSGSGISSLQDKAKSQPLVIYKSGDKRKLKEELHGVATWHDHYPGVAPQILAYNKHDKGASLLIEHLQGMTFEHIVLHEPMHVMHAAIKALTQTLKKVWGDGQRKRPKPASFVRQTRKRLADVYAVHPEFRQGKTYICGQSPKTFEALLQAAEKVEYQLKVPRSMLIHGDFNIDNILYEPNSKQIHFIDLHRSTHMDYVQDVSVFIISHDRLQVFDAPQRRRIRKQIHDFYQAMQTFATQQGDSSFQIRLALGLARSLATSTRFILDPKIAQRMFLRAHYLLKQVAQCDPQHPEDYQLPIKELFK